MGDEFKDLKYEEKRGATEDKGSNWIMALVLIVVGTGLLLSNFTAFSLHNWWALFLLIPAITMLRHVWAEYQRHGRLTSRSTGALIGGLTVVAAMAVFLFNLSWSRLWPIGFIFGGISILLSSRR